MRKYQFNLIEFLFGNSTIISFFCFVFFFLFSYNIIVVVEIFSLLGGQPLLQFSLSIFNK